jgi:LuxR family transcriptional regulator, maltose regulon positive regulatory protein
MQLIPSKIAPPVIPPRLRRERLLDVLEESLICCTSTILSGRAGTGKTTLAADFADSCGRRVAWYKVDAPDADCRTFFQYLVATVGAQRPGFGQGALSSLPETLLADEASLAAEFFVHELLERVSSPLLVVIEDLHLIYDTPWVVPFFRRLLPLLPAEVHLLITGRSLPPAPLWRMRSKQMLRVIDEAALAFTPVESIELFSHFGLAPEQARKALAETHGRAALMSTAARVAARGNAARAFQCLSPALGLN